MNTIAFRHYNVTPDYGTPIQPSGVYVSIDPPAAERADVQKAARIWFNKRKLRQHTRQILDFISLPNRVTLKYKVR